MGLNSLQANIKKVQPEFSFFSFNWVDVNVRYGPHINCQKKPTQCPPATKKGTFPSLRVFQSPFPSLTSGSSLSQLTYSGEQMESPEENPSWVFDLALIDDIPVSAGDFSCLEPGFRWPGNTISVPTRSFRFLSLTFPSNHYYRLLVENNCLHFFLKENPSALWCWNAKGLCILNFLNFISFVWCPCLMLASSS